MLDMNPKIREQWCAALRSGEYEQTKGALRRYRPGGKPAGYCCLGVLTDLYVKAGNPETYYTGDAGDYIGRDDDSVWNTGVLSDPVTEWAGLSSDNPRLRTKNGLCGLSAAELNDEGVTFAEIADRIDGGAEPAEVS
jgi:hypothetical protein